MNNDVPLSALLDAIKSNQSIIHLEIMNLNNTILIDCSMVERFIHEHAALVHLYLKGYQFATIHAATILPHRLRFLKRFEFWMKPWGYNIQTISQLAENNIWSVRISFWGSEISGLVHVSLNLRNSS